MQCLFMLLQGRQVKTRVSHPILSQVTTGARTRRKAPSQSDHNSERYLSYFCSWYREFGYHECISIFNSVIFWQRESIRFFNTFINLFYGHHSSEHILPDNLFGPQKKSATNYDLLKPPSPMPDEILTSWGMTILPSEITIKLNSCFFLWL